MNPSTTRSKITPYCEKVPHDPARGGYLHDEADDGPYDVDGCVYCGRCHHPLPHSAPSRNKRWEVITGDALKVLDWHLRLRREVTAVVMDPPYGIEHESNRVAPTTKAKWMNKTIANDACPTARDAIIEWAGDERPWCAFGSWKVPPPLGTRGVLVWDKGPASGMGDLTFPWKGSWEHIYVGGYGWKGERGEGVLTGHTVVSRASMGRVHPNEKPVSLMRALLEKLPRDSVVLDPFCGSGSTGVACVQLGMEFVGIELEPEYADIARRRIADAAPLFVPPQESQSEMFGASK